MWGSVPDMPAEHAVRQRRTPLPFPQPIAPPCESVAPPCPAGLMVLAFHRRSPVLRGTVSRRRPRRQLPAGRPAQQRLPSPYQVCGPFREMGDRPAQYASSSLQPYVMSKLFSRWGSATLAEPSPITARASSRTPAKTPHSSAATRGQQRAERPRPWATKPASPAADSAAPESESGAARLSMTAAAQRAGPLVCVWPGKAVLDASPRDGQRRPRRSGTDSRRSSAATPRGGQGAEAAAGQQSVSPSPSGGAPALRLRSMARRSAPPAYRLDALAGRQL